MDWTQQLQERLADTDLLQLSIDGQIWTIDARQGAYSFYNEFGREEVFENLDQLTTAIQAWYENPVIAVV
ncbi:MAG: hypothetical protein WCC10_17790 [Tumebacillaceae bacterium]